MKDLGKLSKEGPLSERNLAPMMEWLSKEWIRGKLPTVYRYLVQAYEPRQKTPPPELHAFL